MSIAAIGELSLDGQAYDQLSNLIRDRQGARRRRSINKLGIHEIDGTRYHVGLQMTIATDPKRRTARFVLDAHHLSTSERITASARNRQMRQFAEIQEILSDLEQLHLNSQLHSHVDWAFQPASKKPIIALPLVTVHSPTVPFTEISGIRLRKVTSEGTITVTLDLARDRSLLVTLVFPLTGATISNDMIDHIALRADSTIEDYVLDSGEPPIREGEQA